MMNLHLLIVLTLCSLMVPPAQAESVAASSDSLSEQLEAMVKRYQKKADQHSATRIVKKVVAGTASGVALGIIVSSVQAARWEDPDPYTPSDGREGIVFFLQGLFFGTMVGFPIGVTLVDPYDSFAATLMGGIIGGIIPVVGPIVGSLYASEKSRKPLSTDKSKPQDHRGSFTLVPTLNGGLSAIAQLRF